MSQSENSVFVIYREGSFGFEEISKILEMMPDNASVGTKQGENTAWKLFTPDKDLHIEEQLRRWVDLLGGKTEKLKELEEGGWTIDLDCLVQPEDGAAIACFDSELLRQLSNLHVNLIIRFWG
ncbi:DUF4279 domain-containing protein [Thalassolituus sp. UBA3500]|uniref:DUF4279 domain-containing protein n=1 Tax=Thalassolituus sp. UBA3500 TaxID=1947664 RepID=UPI000C0DF07B|nr:DUF4279 domain-containing protein [Thalassolituus sp. UBA3500]MBN56851.1 hypothetical protein [Oceanospirillaceae bacterium]|tara:strand:- start:1310 stop:1678 length:369 start_codon:yes stop_codon:yes gene_type:complete